MAIYDNLESMRKLSTASLTAIVDVTNLNFKDLSDANLEFLTNIKYDEDSNTFEVFKGTFENVDISDTLSMKLDGVPTFTIDSLGRVEGQELLVKVSESKRRRFTDFPDFPEVGVPGEVIYTGIQNQGGNFGEDFIGYLDNRGWVSLTTLNNAVAGLALIPEIGSPLVLPTVTPDTGFLWLGPPGHENKYKPDPLTLYLSDDEGNVYDVISNHVWEKVDQDAIFKLDGTVVIGDLSNQDKRLRYVDGNQQTGYVLTSDPDGNASWQASSGGTGGNSLNVAYEQIAAFTADVSKQIPHSLGTQSIIVELIDTTTNERIEGHIDNYQDDSVDITLTDDKVNVKVVVLAAGGLAQGNVSLIEVNAVGPNDYLGTLVSGSIIEYKSDVIYLVDFDLNNISISPQETTLNIEGLGEYPIEKGTLSGWLPLDQDDIIATVKYYLAWDGTRFQFYESNPVSGGPTTYTNLNPTPSTLGGISAGSTFLNQTMTEMWDAFLYPYQVPNFTTFVISGQSTTLEVGDIVNNINRTFTWATSNPGNIQTNSISIKNITGGTVTLGSSLTNDGTEIISLPSTVTYNVQTSHVWKIEATRSNLSIMAKNYQINWRWRRFWGTNVNTILNEAQIEALAGSNLSTSPGGTFNLAAGGHKYFAFPIAFAEPSVIKDTATNIGVAMASAAEGYNDTGSGPFNFMLVSVTNPFGVTSDYRVYRSKNILGGSIEILIN